MNIALKNSFKRMYQAGNELVIAKVDKLFADGKITQEEYKYIKEA